MSHSESWTEKERKEIVGCNITPLLTSNVPCTQGVGTKSRAVMNRVGGAMGVLMVVVQGNTTFTLVWAIFVQLSACVFKVSLLRPSFIFVPRVDLL